MGELHFNIFNIIIAAGIIHGFIFSFIITINKNLKSKTSIFLALTILSLALSNLQYWFIDTNIIPRFYYEQNKILYVPFEFLIVPFFYFFTKSFIKQKVTHKQITYILLPFGVSIMYLLCRHYISSEKLFVKWLNIVVEYISIIFSIVLIVIIFQTLRKHENKNQAKNQIPIKTKWLKNSLIIGIALCLLWGLSFNLFENLLNTGYYKYYPLWIGMSLLVYWIGYTAILQNHLYLQRVEIRGKAQNGLDKNVTIKKELPLDAFNKIEDLIKHNKLYLNPNLNVPKIAKDTNLSTGYISQLINQHADLNFNDYVNELRIGEAKKMLANDDFKNYTIHAIGLEVGFNSKSSFYAAFKKHARVTPTEYRKSVRNS
ncbi:helix-turn-helix domain-containing protein [Flavobacteriaceae bacterium MHTCC 0001]